MDMVEKVAIAICDGHTSGNADFYEVPEQYRNSYRDAAISAIKAMSYPTEGMQAQGDLAEIANGNASYIWKAMIDAALRDPE